MALIFIRGILMQLVMQEEVEQLQLELQNTIAMYKQVCEDLVQAQNKHLTYVKFSVFSYFILVRFVVEIFHGLREEVMTTSARGHGLMSRVKQLEADVPSIEKAFFSNRSLITH
ncbi:hypothetical protein RJT34_16071 [Clitoria ternatea]|uniref:Uncharacterized protein n=1 Tax=Clitoria ternatea TaxID=43366 RepID=A0AAN9PC02_CLITE